MINETSIKILKLLKAKGSLTFKEINRYVSSRDYIPDNIKLLEDNEYITNLRGDVVNMFDEDDGSIVRLEVTDDLYKIMPKGQAYLEFVQKDTFRFWLPIIISVVALVISAVALIVSMVRK